MHSTVPCDLSFTDEMITGTSSLLPCFLVAFVSGVEFGGVVWARPTPPGSGSGEWRERWEVMGERGEARISRVRGVGEGR